MTLLRRLLPDRFLMVLIAAIVLATLAPASGQTLALLGHVSNAAIFVLFFLHSARLSREAVVAGLRNWRLLLSVLAFGYGLMPLIILLASPITTAWLPGPLVVGVLFLAVLPSTVQSAIAYASIARGNVAASVVAAAASNLIGVVAAPLLLVALAPLAGRMAGDAPALVFDTAAVGRVAALLLLPFLLGQAMRAAMAPVLARHGKVAGLMDRTTIVLAVYVAFCAAAAQGLWAQTSAAMLALLMAGMAALLVLAMALAWLIGGAIGMSREDRITLLFSGTHKSLATGAPMARILLPPALAGPAILPLLLYHQLQLMLSAIVADRLAQADTRIT